jgi:ribosomal protein L23
MKPKRRRGLRNRFRFGYTSAYKKAIVTLEEGYKINLEV